MTPIEKQEVIGNLVERIDKLMSLQTKLNIAKDRAELIKKDKRNRHKIQAKIRRLSLVEPIPEFYDEPVIPKRIASKIRPSDELRKSMTMPVTTWELSEEKDPNSKNKELIKYSDLLSNSPKSKESPMKTAGNGSHGGGHTKNSMSCTPENLEFMKKKQQMVQDRFVEDKRKELEALIKKNDRLRNTRTELNHCYLITTDDIETEQDRIRKNFKTCILGERRWPENQVSVKSGRDQVSNPSQALAKYQGLVNSAQQKIFDHKVYLNCANAWKGITVEDRDGLGVSKVWDEDKERVEDLKKGFGEKVDKFSEKVMSYLSDVKEFIDSV